LIYDTNSTIINLNFCAADTGLIPIRILATDKNGNIADRVYFIKKSSVPINNDSGYFYPIPYLLGSSLSDSLAASGGYIFSAPSAIEFYFNNRITADSAEIYLFDDVGGVKLETANISDTALRWSTIADSISYCKQYYFQIQGTDANNSRFVVESNRVYFKMPGDNTKKCTIKNSSIYLEIPASAFDRNYWITVDKLPINSPEISAALVSDSAVTIIPPAASNIVKLTARDLSGLPLINNPSIQLKLGLCYPDGNNDGFIEGAPNLSAKNLFISYYDQSLNKFIKPTNSQYIDELEKYAYIYLTHFSIWALSYNYIGVSLAESLKIYPSGRHAIISEIDKLTILLHSIGGEYTFKIFSKNGALVRNWQSSIPAGNISDSVFYDLKDNRGRKIKSGAYFLFVKSHISGEEIIKPFIVIE